MRAAGRERLGDALLRRASARLARRRADWARAMAAEAAELSGGERLRWAAGAWLASWRTPEATGAAAYAAALLASVGGMAAYQWSADESLLTLALACALAAGLVLARPSRVLLPAVCVGLVVFGVNLLGTLTGLRPGYETRVHTIVHDLRWMLMVPPVLAAAAAARWLADRSAPALLTGRRP